MDKDIGLFSPSVEDHRAEDKGRIVFEHGRDRAKNAHNIGVGSFTKLPKNKDIIENKLNEKPRSKGVHKRSHWRSRKVFGRRWSSVVCLESPKASKREENPTTSLSTSEVVFDALKVIGNSLADPLRMFFGLGAEELRAAGDLFSGHVDRTTAQRRAEESFLIDKATGRRVSLTANTHHGHALRPLAILSVYRKLPEPLQRDIHRGISLRPTGRFATEKTQAVSLPPRIKCKGVAKFVPGPVRIFARRVSSPHAPPPSPNHSPEPESEMQHFQRMSRDLQQYEHRMASLESRLAPVAFFLPKLPENLQRQIRNFDRASLRPSRQVPLPRRRNETPLQHDRRVAQELWRHEQQMACLERKLAPAAFFGPRLPRGLQAQIRHFNTATLRPTARPPPLAAESEMQHFQRVSRDLQQYEHRMASLETRLAPVAFFLPKLPQALQRDLCSFPRALLRPTGNLDVRPQLPPGLKLEIQGAARVRECVLGAGSPKQRLTVTIPTPPTVVPLRHTGMVSPRPPLREALLFDIRRCLKRSLHPAGNLTFAPKLPADLKADIERGVAWRHQRNLAVRPWLPLPLQEQIRARVALRRAEECPPHVRESVGGRRRKREEDEAGLREHKRRSSAMLERVHHDAALEGKLMAESPTGMKPGVLTIHLRGNCGYCPSTEECVCDRV